MTDEIEIVPYRPELEEGMLALQRHLWRGDEAMRSAYLDWKYHRNPYLDDPVIRLACRGDEVVGMRGFWGARWEVGGRTLDVPCAGDVVIAPEHRNRGLFARLTASALTELADRGYRFAFNLSSGPVTHVNCLALGWRGVGSFETLLRKGGAAAGEERDPFALLDRAANEPHAGIAVEREPRPAEMADLVERIPRDDRLRHVRDREYLAWRFGNALSSYRFLFWWEGSREPRLAGYLVLRAPRGSTAPGVVILDWEGSSEPVRAGLLEAAIGRGGFERISIWSASLGSGERDALRASGFEPYTEKGPLGRARPTALVSPVGGGHDGAWSIDERPLLDRSTWDLRMLASDAF